MSQEILTNLEQLQKSLNHFGLRRDRSPNMDLAILRNGQLALLAHTDVEGS